MCGLGLELAGLVDRNLFARFAALGAVGLDLLDDIHALDDGSEDHVLAVQP